ncbi:MAG: MlaE family lipid ABC transporter permease subunit [Syntrophobacterales bacterium]|nr:MlaE family lipid ABC transporter permease subunit [Syntrophobacterales bacterium]
MKRLTDTFGFVGRWILGIFVGLGRIGIFFLSTLRGIAYPPSKTGLVIKQIYFIGHKSMFVIIFTGAFSGMVLGLQGYYALSKFGSEGFLGSGVILSLVRELGPVFTALMVVGRACSAMCAEIGIMRIDEQIDALRCMAIDPHGYLVLPRLMAALIAFPLLTHVFDVVGVWGGYAVGVKLLGVNPGAYWDGVYRSLEWQDIWMGIVKSLVFAVLTITISTYKGYYAGVDRGSRGAEDVSEATTSAVVTSSVTVLVADYIITSIML